MDEQNNQDGQIEVRVERRIMPYRFWLFVTLSLLFIITFIYYLPLRFQTSGGGHVDEHGAEEMNHFHGDDGAHAHHELPTAADIAKLPLHTPNDRVDRLPYTQEGGVKVFRLEASEFRWEMQPGNYVHAWGYSGQIPGPEIRVKEGDFVQIIVKNNLPDATSMHWHGIDVPWESDGVPGVTQKAIAPGEEFTYQFVAKPAGTHFYHTHGKDHATSAQQLDMGLSGAFIIESNEPAYTYDKDYTLVLDEWDVLAGGVNPAISHVHGAFEEGAVPEFNTFTINGRVFPYVDPLNEIKLGEKILIRFINAGTSAFHPMHLHGHNFEVVALDGNPIPPASVERRNTTVVHPGETADILVTADNPGAWLLHCHHVHHASAGMITLFQYEGFEPISPLK